MNIILDEFLKKRGMKNTRQRAAVLNELSKSESACSQPDLEKKLHTEMDRVTLYRILNSFQENGIVHGVLDQNGTMNYALCSSSCTTNHHHDEHIHFNCTQCKRIYCLKTKVPKVSIPADFLVEKLSLTATGVCNQCRPKC